MTSRGSSLARSISLTVALLGIACASGRPSAPVAPAPPPPPPAVGSWTLTVQTPQGTQQPTLVITGTAESLGGVLSGELGDLELDDVTFSSGVLSFKTSVDFQGQVFDVDFQGTVDGDSISGRFETPFGQVTASGVRLVP